MRMVRQAEDDNARMLRRWVCQNVGEIKIRRDEGALLAAACINYTLIRLAAKRLLYYRVSIVPGRCKQGRQRR